MTKPKIIIPIVVALFLVFSGGVYFLVQYRGIGGPRLAHAMNSEFNYFEQMFQNEPEKPPLPHAIKTPIFIYHSVRPYIQGESVMQDRFDITPELFEEQLVYLKDHGFTPITPDALVTDIKMSTTTPVANPVLLTFDDGWENQYKYAFPLLKKYHMVATFYVYTKPIDAKNVHYISWDQLKEMDAAGMTIGSHTLSHPLLKHSTPAEVKKEIFESKKVLEEELGKSVLHFAQPFGFTSPEIETQIQEAGYATARGTTKGVYHAVDSIFHLNGYFISDKFSDFVYVLNQ